MTKVMFFEKETFFYHKKSKDMKKSTHTSKSDQSDFSIAIVERRPMFRKGLAAVIAENWENNKIIEVERLSDLTQNPDSQTLDLILVGVEDGDSKNTIQQISNLNNRFPGGKLLLYDFRGDVKFIPRLLRLGIYGYLSADFDVPELRTCVNTVLEGKRYISNDIVWEYLNQQSEADVKPKNKLSRMEETVANYLTQGLSVSRIAKMMNRQISTISTVKAKVFKKMEVGNILDLKDTLQKSNSLSSSGTY